MITQELEPIPYMTVAENLLERRADSLSSGQQQRVAAARALIGQRQVAVEQRRQALVMADEQQAGACFAAFGKQQLNEGFPGVVVQG